MFKNCLLNLILFFKVWDRNLYLVFVNVFNFKREDKCDYYVFSKGFEL